ncbi:MAG: orotate phosphoribosyltransferase [Thermoguttaceae bacterium]|nr:orotate phosphoribosyltransferase [Thermoguttaceae bacterium]MDW8079921.1 orotate phosphoribosyltransferase [Thermoguttaceae bacterium]
MAEVALPHRSPELMCRHDSALLVIDVQERLLPVIDRGHLVVWNIGRLIRAAKLLGVPVFGTEQYPKGLGPTVPQLRDLLGPLPSKLMFSCRECGEIFRELRAADRHKVLVVGIEAHVCVLQSVLDLIAEGFRVYVPVDAVGSRFVVDYEAALRRMEASGAILTSTEAVLFEWCEVAGTWEFKELSAIVREQAPAAGTGSQLAPPGVQTGGKQGIYDKNALVSLIKEKALRFGDFTLTSGKKSTYYLDLKQVTLDPQGARLIGAGILELFESQGTLPDAVGGLAIGADPITGAVVTMAGMRGKNVLGFLVRKEAKGHGTQRFVEGPVTPGQRAVIVEDVVTTGGSSLTAAKRAWEFGLQVLGVVGVVDRLEGGREALAQAGLSLQTLLTIEDLGIKPPASQ